MIENEEQFLHYLAQNGVGDNDTVPDATPKAYRAYLRAAAKILNADISAVLFPNQSQEELEQICYRVKHEQQHAQYAPRTRNNAITAMRHYFNFVAERN